jgi:hypothetical protein
MGIDVVRVVILPGAQDTELFKLQYHFKAETSCREPTFNALLTLPGVDTGAGASTYFFGTRGDRCVEFEHF